MQINDYHQNQNYILVYELSNTWYYMSTKMIINKYE